MPHPAPSPVRAEPANNPLVSVIVPVRNAGADLPGLIEALEQQSLHESAFEVVISDDGSTDGSTEGVGTTDGRVRVVTGAPQTSDAARNRGSAIARGAVLAFCDADCRPEPTWLEAGLSALEENAVAAGLIRFRTPDHVRVWGLLDMDLFLDQEQSTRRGRAVTANLFIRRSAFDALGGFEVSLPFGGDYDLTLRAVTSGLILGFTPDAVVWHPVRNAGWPLLRKTWQTQRCAGLRAARDGNRPEAFRPSFWIPFVAPLRRRRRAGRPLGLNRSRLASNGVRPTRFQEARALAILYFLLHYLTGAAQIRGWFEGRRDT